MTSKRFLTKNEISDILSEIKIYNNFSEDHNSLILNNIKSYLTEKLSKSKVYPEIIPIIKDSITNEYHKSIVSAGTCVGVVVGQALGEKQTQSTLNSFHSAGLTVKTVVTGVPRFSELISATKEPKGVVGVIHLKKDLNTVSDIREYLGRHLVNVYFNDIISSYSIEKQQKYKTWYKMYTLTHQENILLNDRFVINIKLDKSIMYRHRINLESVKCTIENKYNDIKVYYSPTNLMELDLVISDIDKIKGKEGLTTEENLFEIYTENVILPILKKIVIKGIEGINDYMINMNEFIIETEGVNMHKLPLIPQIDFYKSLSNNMWDIYELLGIEAVRRFLIEELSKVLNSDGTFINYRHIDLLVDMMTYTGNITSVSRHGIKGRVSPMARASFEESMDNFVRAGVYGEYEMTKSISSSIMLGKNTRIGTGMVDLLYQVNDNDGVVDV